METIDRAVSTITSKYQTTVPEKIRSVLNLKQKDKLCYSILSDGKILVEKANDEDHVIENFLEFIEKSMTNEPQLITLASESRYDYYRKLAKGGN